jgi:hypothetical protein
VQLSFALDLDQKKGAFKHREPKNAEWVDSEDGALSTLTFSDEILVPVDMGGMFSPHVTTFGNYRDYEAYSKDEGLRQLFANRHFPHIERCRVHFERGNWRLFDKESPSLAGEPRTVRGRLVDLCNAFHAAWYGCRRCDACYRGSLEKEFGLLVRGLRQFVARIAFLFHE